QPDLSASPAKHLHLRADFAGAGAGLRHRAGARVAKRLSRQMVRSPADPPALGGADLLRHHWLALDIRADLQRDQLDAEVDRRLRTENLADLAGPAAPGDGFSHHRARLAIVTAGDDHPPWRLKLDSAGHSRRRGDRRRELLATPLPDHRAA